MNHILKISLAAAAAVVLAASCQKDNNPIDNPEENTAVLTFEGEYWDALIDDPQYGGPLLYGKYDEANFTYLGKDYAWYDQGNTELASELCDSYGSKVFWTGRQHLQIYIRDPASTD